MPKASTTEIKDIGITTAKAVGGIDSDGGENIIEYGFVYSTEQNPSVSGNKLVVAENTDNAFEGTITNLTRQTKYYLKAFVTNTAGTAYGNELSFTTNDGMPIVETEEIKDIGITKAKAKGKIKSDGGEALSEYGFVYSENQNPTISSSKLVVTEKTDNVYEGVISNLKTNTKYYVKAFATNKIGTSYGKELSFTTLDGPYLDFTAPILNQNVPVGNSFNITWNTNIEYGTVTIEHWIGTTKTELSNNTEFSAKSFAWAIPSDFTQGSDNFIKIITNSDVSKTYESPKFNISDLVYIPDDAFEQYLIDEKLDDKLDDYIPTAQALKLTTFRRTDVSAPITDLTGLDSFTNLEVLSFDSNANLHVNDIDLSTLTKLKDIRLDGNSDFKLNSVILPKTESLTQLLLRGHNIKTIDFKDIPKLNYLNLNDSSYEVLDVSMLTSLQTLVLRNNKLDRIDVSKITPQQFYITNNPLTCIQVSQAQLDNIPSNWSKDAGADYATDCGFIYVPDDNFETNLINLGYDSVLDDYVQSRDIKDVTNLELSIVSNLGISDMTGIEGFVGLKELEFNYNETLLTTLNLSSNINLEKLIINGNKNGANRQENGKLNSIDLTKNTNLIHLEIKYQSLKSIDISNNTKLKVFDAYGNQFKEINLSSNLDLEKLDLHYFNIISQNPDTRTYFEKYAKPDDERITEIDLSKNTKLNYLDLTGHRLLQLDLSNNFELTNTSGPYGGKMFASYNPFLNCINVTQDIYDNVLSTNWFSSSAPGFNGIGGYSVNCDNSWKVAATTFSTGGNLNTGSRNYSFPTTPTDVSVGPNGKIFLLGKNGGLQGSNNGILSQGSNQKFDWEVIGNTLSSKGDLEYPGGLFISGDGTMYVANSASSHNNVTKKSPSDSDWTIIADSSNGLNNPTDVGIASDGTIYIVYNGDGTNGGGVIKKGPSDSDWSTLNLSYTNYGAYGSTAPKRIKIIDNGDIYILSSYAMGYVHKRNASDGNWITIADGDDWKLPSNNNEQLTATDFDVSNDGTIYVSFSNISANKPVLIKKGISDSNWSVISNAGESTGLWQGNCVFISNGKIYVLGNYKLHYKSVE